MGAAETMDSPGAEYGLVVGSCECGNECVGFVKGRNFLTT
jgi:hypothetical protein